MTLTATTNKVAYSGNGSTTSFAVTFIYWDDTDVRVILSNNTTGAETVWTNGTQYTLTGGDGATGTLTVDTSPTDYTPATGETLTIKSNLPDTQSTSLPLGGALPSTSIEERLDKNVRLSQQLSEELSRAIQFSESSPATSTYITETAAQRANKLLAFDSSGNFEVAQEIGIYQGNWAASTAYVERDIVKDTSNNNIYICITAHTSSGSLPISSNTDSAKWALIVDAASATTSATNAATSATNAATSATAAATSATAAATSATSASTSASTATTQASNASTSATNAASSATSAASAVSAVAWKYTFDNSTSMADPGTGEIRFNHATVGSVTALAIDATSADSGNPDVSDFIASWDDGNNSTHEGYVTFRKSGTPATYAVFSLGTVTDNTGWMQAAVTHVDSNGTWSNADTMYISFTRSGQKGDTGATGGVGTELADNVFRVIDNSDNSKKIAFEASGISGSTTRTITMPNSDVTLVSSGSIANADIDGSAAIATSKISGAVTSIGSHGLATSATTDTTNASNIASGTLNNARLSGVGLLDTAQNWTKGQRGEITALSDGATITPDFADSNNFSVTLGGNRTLANPSNLTAGQSGSIFVTQDGTGSRTLAYGSYWDFVGGTAPTLTTTASKIDRIDYVVRTTGSIHAVASLDLS